MSYCRTSNKSDVYMFGSVSGMFECCSCKLLRKIKFTQNNIVFLSTRSEAILHLQHHRLAGDKVPEYAFKRLKDELRDEGEHMLAHKGWEPTFKVTLPKEPLGYAAYKQKCKENALRMYAKYFNEKPEEGESPDDFLKRKHKEAMRGIRKICKESSIALGVKG